MTFDSGHLKIMRPTVNADGGLPVPTFQEVFRSYYRYRVVGFNRYFTALSADTRADLLVRMQRFAATTADLVVLTPSYPDGTEGTYRIIQTQHTTDEDGLFVTDLTLEKTEGVNDPGQIKNIAPGSG